MLFDALVAGYFRTNAPRALATMIAIALGVAIALGSVLAQRALVSQIGAGVDALDDGVALRVAGDGAPLDERVLARLEDVPGVAEARPIVDGSIVLGAITGLPESGRLVRVEGVDLLHALPGVAASGELVPGPFSPDGSPVTTSEAIEGRAIVVSASLADELRLRRGADVAALAGARVQTLRVADVLPANAAGVDALTAFVDLATAQTLFGSPGRLDRIDVAVSQPANAVERRIASVLPRGARVEVPVARAGALVALGGELGFDVTILGVLALLAGALSCADAVGASVTRRSAEIAALRALGATRGAIARTFVIEGAMYGACGALAGLEAGTFVAQWVVHALVPAGDSAVAQASPQGDFVPLALAFLGGTAVAALASIAPARRAAGVLPAMAASAAVSNDATKPARGNARAIVASIASGIGAIVAAKANATLACDAALVAFAASSLPLATRAFVRVVARTRAAQPAVALAILALRGTVPRVASAATALAVGLAAAVALAIGATSLRSAVSTWAAQTYPGDLLVRPVAIGAHAGFDAAAVARATAMPGIVRVDVRRETHVAFAGSDLAVRGVGELRASRSVAGVPKAAPTPAPAVLSQRFAARGAYGVGTIFALPTPAGRLRLRVAAIRADYTRTGYSLTLDRATYARAFRDPAIDAFAITLARGAGVQPIRRRVIESLSPQRADVRVTAQERSRALAIFDRSFALTAAAGSLVVLLSLGGVGSALSAFVFERRRELALLRVVGATRGIVRAVVLGQAAAIALLGCAAGGALGLALAAAQLALADPTASVDPIALQLPLGTLAATVAVTAAAALLFGIAPARAAASIAVDRAIAR